MRVAILVVTLVAMVHGVGSDESGGTGGGDDVSGDVMVVTGGDDGDSEMVAAASDGDVDDADSISDCQIVQAAESVLMECEPEKCVKRKKSESEGETEVVGKEDEKKRKWESSSRTYARVEEVDGARYFWIKDGRPY